VFPTAVQAVADVHETAPKNDPGLSEVGVGWMLHVVPSHRSTIVPTGLPELSNAPPTAVQAEPEVHETPVKKPNCAPDGLGTGWMLQVVPSQRSARRPEAVFPTAVQAEAEVHETAFKNDPGLAEVGVGWMLHVVPSHRSTIVPTELPELSNATPTAVHATRSRNCPAPEPVAPCSSGDVHDTPFRPLPAAFGGLGVDSMRQLVPSQSSASVPPVDCPTAMQDEGDVHDTPRSCAPRDPRGLTVGWTLH
jgi:hypothetical protein